MSRTQHTDTVLRGSYDREAAQYDERRYHSAEGRLFSSLELAVLRDWIPLASAPLVLDMPAGTGRLSWAMAKQGAKVVGADISANMLQRASSKRIENHPGRVYFSQASGIDLPFPDNTFDVVTSFKFFHLIPNERKRLFVREMARVLKPGKSLVVEFNSPFYGGILAGIRYYFRKRHPGGMRMKCLFPDQVPWLFEGLKVTRQQGVKFPLSALAASILGHRASNALNLWFGRLPGVRYLAYAIIIEAKKPTAVVAVERR